MMRLMAIALIGCGLLYVGVGIALFCFQRALLFQNDPTDVPPADVGFPNAQLNHLKASDGVDLVSWLVKTDSDRLAIYFHGNGGSLAARADGINDLIGLGLSVLAIDYRGFGGSAGEPTEAGLILDADAAYDFAIKLGYPPSRIVIYGESLGTSVAVALAAKRPVGGVILDSAFSSIADVAADRFWMFPIRWFLYDPFRSDRNIADVKAPILMLHGSDDNVVPLRFGRQLHTQTGPNTKFIEIAGASHLVLGEDEAQDAAKTWLAELFGEVTKD